RSMAAYELGRTGDPAAIPHLLAALEDAETHVLISVIQALGTLKSAEAVPRLVEMLQKGGERIIMTNCIRALERIGDSEAVPILIETCRHRNDILRDNAVFALGEIGDERAIPVLESLLPDRTV